MKRVVQLLVLAAMLAMASPAWATWTAGNHVSARSSNGSGPTTDPIDTTGNHAIVVGTVSASGCPTFVHDNKNSDSSWKVVATSTASGFTTTIWTLNSIGAFGSGHTFQAATSGCMNYASILVLGLNSASVTTGPFTDQTASNSGSGTALSAGSITPSSDNEIIISLLGIGIVNGSGFAINSSFTLIEHQDQADFNQGGALAYKIQTSAAAVNPQWTWVNSGSAVAINASLFDTTGVACSIAGSTYTATTEIGLSECFSAATHEGDTVHISGAGFSITSHLTWSAPVNSTLSGDGACTGTGDPNGGTSGHVTCDDATLIIDALEQNSPIMGISISSTGVFTFRGLSFAGSVNQVKDGGMLAFYGPGSLRITQVHYDVTNAAVGSIMFFIGDRVHGVMDHSNLKFIGTQAIYFFNGAGPDGAGNTTWSQASDFGTDEFFFVESSEINGTVGQTASRVSDCFSAGRSVFRFNTLGYMSGPEVHATGHSGDDRGCRSQETYKNAFVVLPGQMTPSFDMHDASSGTSLIWGNVADTDALTNGIITNVTRKGNATYAQSPTPAGWHYCGPSPQSGTVNVVGTAVTRVSGTAFSVSWPAGSMISITGNTCSMGSTNCSIASVSDGDHLTLSSSGGTLSGAAYQVGSAWDQNNSATLGYACIDQPGRGMGDLLTGSFPSKINSASGIISWPNQTLDPIYVWMNTLTPSGGNFYSNPSAGRVVSDRDLYEQASGIQVSASSPFNGTTGTGWGTRANRPTTCTAGVAYFSTDQGSWNTSGAGGQGVLDKCTATNTWTDASYTPFPYPHPLTSDAACTPHHLTVLVQPSSAILNASLGTMAVGVYDSGDSLCVGASTSITLSKNSGATWGLLQSGSSLTKSASGGVATWTDLSVVTTSGSGSIDANASGLTGTTSDSITISPIPPPIPPSTVVGTGTGMRSILTRRRNGWDDL